MKIESLKEILINDLSGEDILNIRQKIVVYKNAGGQKKEVVELINDILTKYKDGEKEFDKLLDLLDFVSGWCQPKYRIWDGNDV